MTQMNQGPAIQLVSGHLTRASTTGAARLQTRVCCTAITEFKTGIEYVDNWFGRRYPQLPADDAERP